MPQPIPSPNRTRGRSLAGTIGVLLVLLLASVGPGRASAAIPASTVPEPTAGWVVLPLDAYRALRLQADPPDPEPTPPPVSVVLSRVDYDLSVSGDRVQGEVRLHVLVLADGWVRVELPDGLLISSARLDGRALPLVDGEESSARAKAVERRGTHVLLARRGPAVIVLDVLLPVSASGGVERVALPPGAGALTSARLALGRAGLDVSVAGGLLLESDETQGAGRYRAQAQPGQALSFAWKQRRDDATRSLPLRYRATLTSLVGVSEDAALISAAVNVSVIQGQARVVSLALPEGLAINEVSGALVADWSSEGGRLQVSFLEPIDRDATFSVAGERRSAREGALDVPLLRAPDAERESGGVAVEVLGAGEITAHTPRGLDPADASDLGAPVAGHEAPSLVSFRYRPQAGNLARTLGVQVARYTPQAVLVANIEEARYRALLTADGKRLVQALYAVRSPQRSFLTLRLPAGATLWSAALDERPLRPGHASDGALLLPLPRGRGGAGATVLVEVSYLERGPAWSERGEASLALPATNLPVSRTGLELFHPVRWRVTPESNALHAAAYFSPMADGSGDERDGPDLPSTEEKRDKRRNDSDTLSGDVKELVDRFRKQAHGGRTAGSLPVAVRFQGLGTPVFLAGELTAAETSPSLRLRSERTSK